MAVGQKKDGNAHGLRMRREQPLSQSFSCPKIIHGSAAHRFERSTAANQLWWLGTGSHQQYPFQTSLSEPQLPNNTRVPTALSTGDNDARP